MHPYACMYEFLLSIWIFMWRKKKQRFFHTQTQTLTHIVTSTSKQCSHHTNSQMVKTGMKNSVRKRMNILVVEKSEKNCRGRHSSSKTKHFTRFNEIENGSVFVGFYSMLSYLYDDFTWLVVMFGASITGALMNVCECMSFSLFVIYVWFFYFILRFPNAWVFFLFTSIEKYISTNREAREKKRYTKTTPSLRRIYISHMKRIDSALDFFFFQFSL